MPMEGINLNPQEDVSKQKQEGLEAPGTKVHISKFITKLAEGLKGGSDKLEVLTRYIERDPESNLSKEILRVFRDVEERSKDEWKVTGETMKGYGELVRDFEENLDIFGRYVSQVRFPEGPMGLKAK